MLQNGTNALAKTSSWEDVYENFFFKEKFHTYGTPVTMEHLVDHIFGQCWSTFRDSDAMWRIYSHDKESVRIKTTIGKLYDSIYTEDACMASTYVGFVEYKTSKALHEWLAKVSPINTSDITNVSVDSLFLKRNNFSHEKEVRVIYQPAQNQPDYNLGIKIYPIDVIDFLEEITFDPQVSDTFMQNTMQMISRYSFPMSRVNKSSLYDFKKVKIELA
ncbi:MAG: DUF2971 domain-containing protein [Prevotella sp.]|jgi:hypothetical protein|nr:DUF2971 domain-containing protein [Prevotella sp.]